MPLVQEARVSASCDAAGKPLGARKHSKTSELQPRRCQLVGARSSGLRSESVSANGSPRW